MASSATLFSPILNVQRTTIAQYVGKVSGPLTVTLETTPTLVPQLTKGIGSAQSFKQTNRYQIFIYAALIRPSSMKNRRGGLFGPFTVTFNDGNQSHSHTIGYDGLKRLQGYGSDKPIPGNQVGVTQSTIGGSFSFVAAAGTTITVTSPYSGDGQYTVNIALETF